MRPHAPPLRGRLWEHQRPKCESCSFFCPALHHKWLMILPRYPEAAHSLCGCLPPCNKRRAAVLAAAAMAVAAAAAQLRFAAVDLRHAGMPSSSSIAGCDSVRTATGVAWQGQPTPPQAATTAEGGTWPRRRLNLDAAGAKSLPGPRPYIYMCVMRQTSQTVAEDGAHVRHRPAVARAQQARGRGEPLPTAPSHKLRFPLFQLEAIHQELLRTQATSCVSACRPSSKVRPPPCAARYRAARPRRSAMDHWGLRCPV